MKVVKDVARWVWSHRAVIGGTIAAFMFVFVLYRQGQIIAQQKQDRIESDIRSCERGNRLRNGIRIGVTHIAAKADISPRESAHILHDFYEDLKDVDCQRVATGEPPQ